MNDDTDKPLNPVGDDALEARLTAWVLGEASPFEAAELEELCAGNPEARLFVQRLRVLHGLIAADVNAGPDDAWKLPAEKRAKVEALFEEPVVVLKPEREPEKIVAIRRTGRRALMALAACTVVSVATWSLLSTVGRDTMPGFVAMKRQYEAPVEEVDFLPGGGGGGGSGWGGGVGLPVPAPSAAPATPPSTPADSLADVEGKSERAAADDGALARLADRQGGGGQPAVGLPAKKPVGAISHLSTNSPFTTKPLLSAQSAEPGYAGNWINPAQRGAVTGSVSAAEPMARADSRLGLESVEFADLDAMSSLAQSTPSGADFDLKSRIRLEASKESEGLALGGMLTSGRQADAGGGIQMETAQAKGKDRFSNQRDGALDRAALPGGAPAEDPFADSSGQALRTAAPHAAAVDAIRPTEFPMGRSETKGPAASTAEFVDKHKADGDEVRRKLHVAEGNYDLGRFDDAHRAYEDALRIDPYNKAARRGMEQVAQARQDYYRAAYDQTRAQLLAEVDGAVEIPVPPVVAPAPEQASPTDDKVRAQLLAEVDRAWDLSVPPVDAPAELEEAKERKAKPVVVEAVGETLTSAEPFSTFSLHVSDASFKLAQAALDRGEVPAAEGIRPEEFYNAFDYGDPAPGHGEPVACAVEQSAHPALPQRNLLRIGVKTGSQGRGGSTPLNLTLLLDSSGSMEREDRQVGLANAVRQLSGLLKEGDTISVIGFARQPRLLADRLPGARAQELNAILARTPSEGGTNLEEGLKLGEQLASRQFNPAAQNRIVLFTDGAANLGDALPETLQAKVEAMRQQGIAFDAAGFGADGLNDQLLERLTRNGNGRYYVVDDAADADASFAKQLAGAFRPAAENVKVQVRFNPARVAKYKLIGFEEHRLNKEDFRDDAVDAAEMAAEEAGNALYQIEALPQGEGEVGEVSVRFRDAASGQMVERTWTIPYEAQAPAFDQAKQSLQLAGLAAFAAEKLRAAPLADAVDFQQLAPVLAKVKARYPNSRPVAELEAMIGKLK